MPVMPNHINPGTQQQPAALPGAQTQEPVWAATDDDDDDYGDEELYQKVYKMLESKLNDGAEGQSENLFEWQPDEPVDFSRSQMTTYHAKIRAANPQISLERAICLSKDMLQLFHRLICHVVWCGIEDDIPGISELAVEKIHEEGHAFKVRLPQGGIHGVRAVSMSVNGFDNDDLERRAREMDYNVSVVLNDEDYGIKCAPELGYDYLKLVHHPDLKEGIKHVFEELDKIAAWTTEAPRKEAISQFIDACFAPGREIHFV